MGHIGRDGSQPCLSRRGATAAVLVVAALMLLPAQAGAVSFFRGDIPVGSSPTSVAVGNFNGGAPDVAVANEGSDNVSILLGNGFGQFTASAPVAVGDAPSSVVVGSFNGDAFADLAVASIGDDNIAIRLGDGTGAFTGTGTVSTGSGSDPRAIAAGDFNGDAHTDLISANEGSSTVTIMLGDGMGAFATDPSPEDVSAGSSPARRQPGRDRGVENTDSHDNSNLDAIIASRTSDQVLVLRGDGTGGFDGRGTTYTAMFSATNPDPSAVAVGSLNPTANSEPDILVANQGGTVPEFLLPGFGILGGRRLPVWRRSADRGRSGRRGLRRPRRRRRRGRHQRQLGRRQRHRDPLEWRRRHRRRYLDAGRLLSEGRRNRRLGRRREGRRRGGELRLELGHRPDLALARPASASGGQSLPACHAEEEVQEEEGQEEGRRGQEEAVQEEEEEVIRR